ncbi:ATP-dependent endonuclease [Anaerostipes hominis (ex Lee et al. 2021)]|uniref:ATP-dependent endonuclease n=1 Tax=Anaerostipes hominis (ex Lee et al. 2021) TaxID=2025494 RepID=UPI000BA4C47D|nr:ATP-dependent endonuclease [Anaerostipes hominis (ex Lee et al. 2021)]
MNLVRIYSDRKINGISTFYKVPENYEKARKMLNRCLSEAIFANKVLLVEGPSEYMLFSKVLAIVHPFYESDGTYILPVDGIGFQMYISILDELEIFNAIRTDNDLRAVKGKGTYSVLGFSRCNKYIGKELLPTEQIQENSIAAKRALYNANIKTLDKIRSEYSIFLSKVDLENDLDEVMHDRLLTLLGETSPVDYLQDSKHYHMVKLIEKLSDTDCRTIYNHYNFACLNDNRTHKVVAAITFTIKAAQEIKDRLSVDITQHFIGTNNSFVIEEIIKPFMKDVYGSDYDIDMSTDYSREAKVKTFQDAINKIKNEGVLYSTPTKNLHYFDLVMIMQE